MNFEWCLDPVRERHPIDPPESETAPQPNLDAGRIARRGQGQRHGDFAQGRRIDGRDGRHSTPRALVEHLDCQVNAFAVQPRLDHRTRQRAVQHGRVLIERITCGRDDTAGHIAQPRRVTADDFQHGVTLRRQR